jgi:hypothetical protein
MLAYLIEMAYIEAGDITRGDRPMKAQTSVPVREPEPVVALEPMQARETSQAWEGQEDRAD